MLQINEKELNFYSNMVAHLDLNLYSVSNA